jgi:hypothetical protein
MGTTRIEQAIDDIDMLEDDNSYSCEDVRLAWLASELAAERHEFDAVWSDR